MGFEARRYVFWDNKRSRTRIPVSPLPGMGGFCYGAASGQGSLREFHVNELDSA
jgi:hypothetical protein